MERYNRRLDLMRQQEQTPKNDNRVCTMCTRHLFRRLTFLIPIESNGQTLLSLQITVIPSPFVLLRPFLSYNLGGGAVCTWRWGLLQVSCGALETQSGVARVWWLLCPCAHQQHCSSCSLFPPHFLLLFSFVGLALYGNSATTFIFTFSPLLRCSVILNLSHTQ